MLFHQSVSYTHLLKLDCDYYLKTGAEKHLWAETVEKQIAKINELYEKMPDEMRADSKLYGVELDSISGRIALSLIHIFLVGHIIYLYNAASVDDIVDKLVTMYGFSVMKEHITALEMCIRDSHNGNVCKHKKHKQF